MIIINYYLFLITFIIQFSYKFNNFSENSERLVFDEENDAAIQNFESLIFKNY